MGLISTKTKEYFFAAIYANDLKRKRKKRQDYYWANFSYSLFCDKEDCYYPTWDKQTTLGSRDGEVVIELASHQCGLGLIRKNHFHVSGA